MEIPSKYNPSETESKWYAYWLKHDFFHSEPDERESYTIVIPPPNVTGVLHMGHMLNNTIQDILIRKARMQGYNACWVPGTDHASIATESKVVQKLRKQGIKKSSLSRDEFLEHAWEWKEEHGGLILNQLKKLGASCDWARTRFTMDEQYSESVIDTFIELFNQDLIYRGERMINWDPAAKTALSDEEVIHKEVKSKLYHVKYQVAGTDEWLTIATTRPETILGDSAICIHPEDERHIALHGKKAIVPLIGREIPIILDDYVDREFGTGCLKVTPAHDVNDYELGKKHNLEIINILNADGTLNENAQLYIGKDRFVVRAEIEQELKESGHLVKVEDYDNKVGFSERTDVPVEPRLSLQWWVKMESLAEPALKVVLDEEINIYPKKYVNTYKHWMENIRDWCISRQLWWGHRIPAFYYGENENDFVVSKTLEEALISAKIKSGNNDLKLEDLKQDEDVMDTWFSSWLWPISVFDGFYSKEEIDYYYPTKDLVTGPDIIFFWVARMIMAGEHFKKQIPFENVYFTGIVRDKLGRKMSKSLGNSPDPLELISEYGADGVRVGLLLTAPAGNDIPFDSKLCEQGRNFSNKIWNAFRLVKSWEVADIDQPMHAKLAVEWMSSTFSKELTEINISFDRFRLSEALMGTYKLMKDDFSGWFLEMIKPGYEQPIDRATYDSTISILEDMIRVLHPFMPFLSEEIWQSVRVRGEKEALTIDVWPKVGAINNKLLNDFEYASQIISNVRKIRKQNNIANHVLLNMSTLKSNRQLNDDFNALITHICKLESYQVVDDQVPNSNSFLVGSDQYYIPFGDTIDIEQEKKKIQKDLDYQKGFIKAVDKKLSNARFVDNAPETVVAIERKKRDDAMNKVSVLEEKLSSLN
ncbi:MAG: valyl-tRNA synthetase [Patiriisocius sp.]|jgi:valyl-tRNA synthetase